MKRAAPFAVRSNRIRSHAFRFLMECSWKFGSKNVAFLTSQMFASLMIRVFPSLEHSTDYVRKPTDNFRTFVCPLRHQTTDGINAIFMSNKT